MKRLPPTGSLNRVRVDNEHKLKDAFQNDHGYVPAYYLFDGEGKELRSFAAGERGLDLLQATLDRVMNASAAGCVFVGRSFRGPSSKRDPSFR